MRSLPTEMHLDHEVIALVEETTLLRDESRDAHGVHVRTCRQ